jgi:hypothetical protein
MNDVTSPPDLEGSNYLVDIAARIKAEHEAVTGHLRQSLKRAMAAGNLLNEARSLVPHGQWLPWLKDHCSLSERVAQQYMKLARNRELIEKRNTNPDSDLTIVEALALTKTSRVLTPKLKSHPLKDKIIPDYDWPGFDIFVDSIRRIGLIYSIVLYEGMIPDGRARYRACLQAGVEPHFRVYDGDDPLGHIWVLDFCRTNLSPDQQAVLRLECEKLKERVPCEAAR